MDVLASHQMRAAVLGGLYRRERTGEGWYAEVSLLGSGLTALANQGTNALGQRQHSAALGLLSPQHCPLRRLASLPRWTHRVGRWQRQPIQGTVRSARAFRHRPTSRILKQCRTCRSPRCPDAGIEQRLKGSNAGRPANKHFTRPRCPQVPCSTLWRP